MALDHPPERPRFPFSRPSLPLTATNRREIRGVRPQRSSSTRKRNAYCVSGAARATVRGMTIGEVTRVFALEPDALRCPYPHYDRVRDEQPVVYVPEIECWLVTRYADIVQVARDPQTFSSVMPTGPILARQR